jgi:hypothetical protein
MSASDEPFPALRSHAQKHLELVLRGRETIEEPEASLDEPLVMRRNLGIAAARYELLEDREVIPTDRLVIEVSHRFRFMPDALHDSDTRLQVRERRQIVQRPAQATLQDDTDSIQALCAKPAICVERRVDGGRVLHVQGQPDRPVGGVFGEAAEVLPTEVRVET